MKNITSHEQKVAQEGEQAYERGAPLTANPYQEGKNDYNLWSTGWLKRNREAKKQNFK